LPQLEHRVPKICSEQFPMILETSPNQLRFNINNFFFFLLMNYFSLWK
jgi:hypothetical protein